MLTITKATLRDFLKSFWRLYLTTTKTTLRDVFESLADLDKNPFWVAMAHYNHWVTKNESYEGQKQ